MKEKACTFAWFLLAYLFVGITSSRASETAESAGPTVISRSLRVVNTCDQILVRISTPDTHVRNAELSICRQQLHDLLEESKLLSQTEYGNAVSRLPVVVMIVAYALESDNLAAAAEMQRTYEAERSKALEQLWAHERQQPRKWTSIYGSTAVGRLVSCDGELAVIRRANGRIVKVPRSKLSAQDNEFLNADPHMGLTSLHREDTATPQGDSPATSPAPEALSSLQSHPQE